LCVQMVRQDFPHYGDSPGPPVRVRRWQ
jgi:hypothetical protein